MTDEMVERSEPWHGGDPGATPRPARGFAWIAWIVIIAIGAAHILHSSLSVPEVEAGTDDPVGDMLIRIQGRYLIGAGQIQPGSGGLLLSQASQFDVGTLGQRLRFTVLAGELAGPAEGRQALERLIDLVAEQEASGFEPSAPDLEVMRILGVLFPPVDADDPSIADAVASLTGMERDLLVERLGWYGDLAVVPLDAGDDTARDAALAPALRTFAIILVVFSLAVLAGLGGLAGLIVMLVLAFLGRLAGGVKRSGAHHGIYAETFAVWFLLFFALQFTVGMIPGLSAEGGLLAILFAFFGSLLALAWPVARGIEWRQVRRDIGWTTGRAPWLEPFTGLACYAMTLPILAIGVTITFVFMLIDGAFAPPPEVFQPQGGPVHPIIGELAGGNITMLVLILILAAVAAPIVEETMFRGVLYRHLRDGTTRLGPVLSIIASTLINTFVFAAIHPQGWIAVPALMSLAIGFTLAREWRGTVIPSMVMHGFSNGFVLCLLATLSSA